MERKWTASGEYKWREQKRLETLAKLREHFLQYAPKVYEKLMRREITQNEAHKLIDTHCYNVVRRKLIGSLP